MSRIGNFENLENPEDKEVVGEKKFANEPSEMDKMKLNTNQLENDEKNDFPELVNDNENEYNGHTKLDNSLDNIEGSEENDYSRPTHWRSGMRDQVWDSAKDENGVVHDPLTGKIMSKDEPWDMGHKPGYEFRKHQDSAAERGIEREQFLDEYYNPEHYQPELPSSNRSHKGENLTDEYFGD